MQVTGPALAPASIRGIVARLREALASAGAVVDGQGPGEHLVVVAPAAWYAAAASPPSQDVLRHAVGYSVAPYGSVALQDDAEVGRRLAAIAHQDARCVAHLERVGCRAVHVPLGGGGQPEHDTPRPVAVMTLGEPTPRRLRVIARGADDLDAVRCAHLFPDRSTDAHFGPDPLRSARVLVDVAPDADAAPDLAVLLAAAEAGAAVVTDRLGAWPTLAIADAVLAAPPETAFRHAAALAADPATASARAAALHAALVDHATLASTGRGLLGLLARDPAPLVASPRPAALSPHAAPVEPAPPIVEVIRREAAADDAAMRAGLQQALGGLRRVRERLDRLEHGADAATVEIHRSGPARDSVRVSVLIPAHQAHRTLAETLDSVASAAAEAGAQGVEAIVVDDASPGPDAEVAAAWGAAHPDLPLTVVRHAVTRGLSGARNTAAGAAVGELVLALDADDLLRPHGLARLVAALDADRDAAFAYGILERFDASGPTGLVGLYPWAPERMRTGNHIPALALIRRAALLELGGYADMDWGFEDWDLWCRIAESGGHGTWVPEIVARYRQRPGSMSAGLQLSRLGPLADMLERHPALLG